jgi:hypothetical protein
MTDNQYHYAFDAEYSGIPRELTTAANIFPYPTFQNKKGVVTSVIWDTGATYSSLSPKIVQELGLKTIDTIVVHGVNNATKAADVVIASITLSDSITFTGKRFSVIEIPGADVLIGMDIIMLGDFAISNGEGKTRFSFVMPPFMNKISFTEKANDINDRLSRRNTP